MARTQLPLPALRAALSMLTRLVPHQHDLAEPDFAAAVKWYPVAGFVVGLFATLPAWLGLAEPYPTVQGLLYVLASLWATRALHWDGLADVADAWGSGKRGEAFRAVMKDSRTGAFGVIALCMGLLAQVVLAGVACEKQLWWLLVLGPAAGRVSVILLAASVATHHEAGLGRLVGVGASASMALFQACVSLFLFWCFGGFPSMLAFTIGWCAVACGLGRLASREGGLSGDFYGASIILVEIVALFCATL